jgi:hypothetical protein
MPAKMNIIELLGFKDLYPEENPPDKSNLAHIVGRDNLFKFCAYFLAHFRNNGIPENEQLLLDFFSFKGKIPDNKNYQIALTRYRSVVKNNPGTQFNFVSVESLLKVFLWTTQHPEIPMEQPEDPKHILPLFKLFLLFNDETAVLCKKALREAEGIPVERRPQQLILATSFSQTDFIHAIYAQIFKTQFYKGAKLLKFMSGHSDYLPLLNALLADFKSNTKEDYFKALGAAIGLALQPVNNNWSMLNVPPGPDFKQACFFLDKLSIVEESVADLQNDYLELRNKPLIKYGEGSYLVIYDMFLAKKIYNGLVFYLSSSVNKDPGLFKASFFGRLRQDFSEGVLVYDVFDYIFAQANTVKISGNQFKYAGIDREPDYYIRQGNDVLLVESKDFYIKGEIKLSYDFALIEKELKEGRLGKAVVQLEANIRRTIMKQLKIDTAYDVDDITIFPIILVHDALYSAPGLNFWVNIWLKGAFNEMKEDPAYRGFEFKKVYPVTIVEIDTLLFYEENIRGYELDLVSLLKEFHAWTQYEKNDFKDNEEFELYAAKSVAPFSQFVRHKARQINIELKGGRMHELLKEFGLK